MCERRHASWRRMGRVSALKCYNLFRIIVYFHSAHSLSALSARLIARHAPSALSKRECTPPIRELEVA